MDKDVETSHVFSSFFYAKLSERIKTAEGRLVLYQGTETFTVYKGHVNKMSDCYVFIYNNSLLGV